MVRNLYKVPDNLVGSLKQVTAPFGGVEAALALLSPSRLDYLLVFPGVIYAVSPWRPRVDLRDYDFVNGSAYSVYDAAMNHLYTERTTNGVFGWREHDRELLRTRPHGDFVHLKFMTRLGPRMALLWIVRQKTAKESQYDLQMLRLAADRAQGSSSQHEVFVEPRCLPAASIQSYFLSGSWEQQLMPSEVRNDPAAVRINHAEKLPFFLYPNQDGWLVFYQEDTLLVAQDIQGEGVRRLRSGPGCSLFVQTTNTLLSAPHPTNNDIIGRQTGSSWAASDTFIKVQVALSAVDSLEITLQADMPPEAWLWLGLTDAEGREPEFAWGYERQYLDFEFQRAPVSFRALRHPWHFNTAIIGRDNVILHRIGLSTDYRLEDSRVALVTLTALQN